MGGWKTEKYSMQIRNRHLVANDAVQSSGDEGGQDYLDRLHSFSKIPWYW